MYSKKISSFVFICLCFCSSLFSQKNIEQNAPSLSKIEFMNNELPNFEDKFIFLDFWATWCGPCIKSMPHTDKLAEKYKDKFVFLAISDEKEEPVRQFLKKHKFKNILFGLDIKKDLYSKLEIKSIPKYFIISPQNKIVASGLTTEVTDNTINSILTQVKYDKPTTKEYTKISQENLTEISSIVINERKDMKSFSSQSGYTLILRDSINVVLPFLYGAKIANRIEMNNLPKKMIEVKLFSRNNSFNELKKLAHDQVLVSYKINKKENLRNTVVSKFILNDTSKLNGKSKFQEPGVAIKRYLLNETTYVFDNYTIDELVEFLEFAYFPRLFYVQSITSNEYDWELPIVEPSTKSWVDYKELKKIMKDNYAIDIIETYNKEKFTIYNSESISN